ncbi:maestro heat-like repeat family member 5 [Hipposideros larvatus]
MGDTGPGALSGAPFYQEQAQRLVPCPRSSAAEPWARPGVTNGIEGAGPQDHQALQTSELGQAQCQVPFLGPKEVQLSMVAAPSDGFHRPHWRSDLLSPTEDEEEQLDFDHPGRTVMGKRPSDRPPWEDVLVGKIRVMLVMEKSLVLEAISHHIQEHNQLIEEEVSDASVQELLASLNLDLKQPLEKNLLFHIYGLVLRECASVDLVKKHLAGLLELSQQSSRQREGIALAVGIMSTSHMEVVWAMLEHLGHTRFLRSTFMSPDSQEPDPDVPWKWVGSTCLLCYGQMAMHAGERILPWVDSVASRMVYYYSCSGDDSTLKSSFLSAAIMLTRALKWESSTQGYKFTQIPELIHCLLEVLQKEPNFLATLLRQKIILVIVGLSLRPSLKPMVKSRILQTCLQSLYELPPTETLDSCLPPQESAPDVMVLYEKSMQALNLLLQTFVSENKSMDEVCFLLQHTEPWLKSDKSHERKRVVQSIFLFLKCLLDCMILTEEATPSVLGHQLGLLMLLCRDEDEVTWSHSYQCVYLLLQLPVQQKGEPAAPLAQALDKNLTTAQHTQFVLTLLLHGLRSHSHPQCDLASRLLLMISEYHSIRREQVGARARLAQPLCASHAQCPCCPPLPAQVAEILQGLFQVLPSVVFSNVLQTMMKVVTVVGTQHTQETVEAMLSLCHPSERQVAPLWKALAAKDLLVRKVITLLYMRLKVRPPKELLRLSEQAQLTTLQALDTIYELLYMREYKAIMRWAFAGILLGLLTQLYYLFEVGMVEGITDYQEDTLEMKPLGPCRTCLEALKGLFWTTSYWEVFACLKLQKAWELFEHLETYTEGVTLLARAMAQHDCEVQAVLGQAVILLTSSEERDNIVAVLLVTEFLNSHDLTQYMSRKSMDNCLSLSLKNPNQLVRAMSLKGLRSIWMHPKKVGLLQNWLDRLLDSFLTPEPQDLMGLMKIVGDILCHLGMQGVGAFSLQIAQNLRPLFDDVRLRVCATPTPTSTPGLMGNVRWPVEEPAGASGGQQCQWGRGVRSAGPELGVGGCEGEYWPLQVPGPERKGRDGRVPDTAAALGLGAPACCSPEGRPVRLRQDREDVRGGAIFLYGNVIYSGGRRYQPALRKHAFWSLVPLLFHLADSCPAVVTKTKFTFLRCAILLKWEFRKELFSRLAWGHGVGAESDIFMYMVESNFTNHHQFFMQALIYLSSPHKNLKLTAMKFIGRILQDYFGSLCFSLKTDDVKTLMKREHSARAGSCLFPWTSLLHPHRLPAPVPSAPALPGPAGVAVQSDPWVCAAEFEVLKQEQDSVSRKFYHNHLDDIIELSQSVTR